MTSFIECSCWHGGVLSGRIKNAGHNILVIFRVLVLRKKRPPSCG